jgi:hypothetical protein
MFQTHEMRPCSPKPQADAIKQQNKQKQHASGWDGVVTKFQNSKFMTKLMRNSPQRTVLFIVFANLGNLI